MNTITINNHKAVITLDEELGMFRGEFIELNGGADFYAESLSALMEEGARSLVEFIAVCKERGVDPFRKFSGQVPLRMPKDLHAAAAVAAAAKGISLNQYINQAVEHETEAAA